jgi:hypothetical protein
MVRILLIFSALLSVSLSLRAQSLDNLDEQEPIKVSGSFNATTIGYSASGISQRRDPFNWYTTGNINLSLYGWNIPLSFSLSNQQRSFSQPFNRYGITPQYKWVRAYAGYNSMNFSRYTLAGHVFLGGGFELTPGKWQISAMYGELNKAVPEDTLAVSSGQPSYRRMGYGMKVGYHNEQHSLEFILFRAKDDPESISYVPVQSEVLPKENLVISLLGRKQLFQRVHLNVEWASSAYTHDIRSEALPGMGFWGSTALFTPRSASQYNNAFNTSLGYTGNNYNLQLNYERIDPGFNTLGAYFFNDDLENWTVSGSWRLWAQKLTLNANVGTQRNNLDDTEVSATERVIASVNAMLVPDEHWNINTSYSNFTTFTNIRPRFDPFFENELDTLNFYQINQNATGTVSYAFGGGQSKQSLMLMGSYQLSEDDSGDTTASNISRFYNANFSYRYMVSAQGLSMSTGVSVYQSELEFTSSRTIGPNISLNKTN